MLQTHREIGKLDGQIIEVRREYKSFREDYDSDIGHMLMLMTTLLTSLPKAPGITGVLGLS